jgi:hypothetical protein
MIKQTQVRFVLFGGMVALLLFNLPRPLQASPVEVGYRDFSFGTTGNSAPTGEKPESKLWWNDGLWWGSLYNDAAQEYHVYRLDLGTQTWIDTGTVLDDRNNTLADTLWDGQKLYVVSHVFTTNAQPVSSSSNWGRLYRYSYNSATKTYSLDGGFPVTVTKGKSETLTVAKDSTGQLWVTYVESSKVMVNHSLGNDATWDEPVVLPASDVNVNSDDISAVIAFGGDKIGVMWSNQVTDKTYFAVHQDADADNVWLAREIALPGSGNETSDDHINLKQLLADGDGRVYAAVKTSETASDAPLVMLLVRAPGGGWSQHTFGRKSDAHTRPIVLLDEENSQVYMFATSPESGGAIYYKTTPMSNIQFAPGKGQPFIQSSTDPDTNNATSTKQNLNSTTGLLVLASDSTSDFYLHNYLSLGPGGPTATATNTGTPTSSPTATHTPTSGPSPTATDTPTVTATPTATRTPTITPTATETPVGVRLKDITFEDGSLTHPVSGADSAVGTVVLDGSGALKGTFAADFPTVSSSYLVENFSGVDDAYVSFYVRVNALPGADVRLVFFSNAGTTVGNLLLRATGALRLRNGSTTIGAESPPLAAGTLYRLGLHQKRGAGGNAVLEAYLATGDAAFGAPFASTATGAWTTQANRLRVGATTGTLDATVDDIRLDSGAMPGPSQ